MFRSFANTVGSIISSYVGYCIPFILNSHASWLNLTVGGALLWIYQHYFAPSVTNNGVVGAIARGLRIR